MDFEPSPAPIPQPLDCPSKDNIDLVKALVVLAVIAMFLLHILGSLRRLSSSGLLHAVVTGVYTVSYPLVAYTIGLMNSSDWYHPDFALWAVFLLLLLGSTDSLTACRLSDIDNWKGTYMKHLFKGFLLVSIALKFIPHTPYLHTLSAILCIVVLKSYVMIASMRTVSKEYLCNNVKVIAEYMQHKDNLVVRFNPVTMEGYRYMVAGEKNCCVKGPDECSPWYNKQELKITTVEQIWQCPGNLLVLHERAQKLKDLCLSMALSKMLNRRFAGFKLSEASLDKTHDLMFKGLLAGKESYHRVSKVIEQELVFVHDLYYTRYYYLYQKGSYFALGLPVIMLALCLWLTCLLILKYPGYSHRATISITVVLAFLEAYQLYLFIASGWFKVALIRSYVITPCLQRGGCFLEMVIRLLISLKAFSPWKRRLGQYCILKDLGRKKRFRNCLHYATLRLVNKAKNKKGCKKSVKLSEDVKKAIVDSLVRSKGHLTNGATSLRNNGVDGLLRAWACNATPTDDGSVTRTILIWHLATSLCEQQLDAQSKKEENVKTASTLSRYCMHLLAIAPHLLPDHSSISDSIVALSIERAGKFLEGKGAKQKIKERSDKLMKITINDDDACGDDGLLVIARGTQLARDLTEHIQEQTLRWKVLSDFWAEMMLYVSPSDDARAHLETLARGGEFITHLWALLTHAGVLHRGPSGPCDV